MSETEPPRANSSLEEALFEAAVAKDTPQERAAFVDIVCRDDAALRSRLEVLLEGYFEGEGFLTRTPVRAEGGSPAPTPPAPTADPVTQTIGRYKLLEKLGEGGFGEVWMAEQRQPVKRRVALKITKLGMDSKQVVARFEAERQALALMDHPNIAKIFDADITDTGRPYFVMELVRGMKITDYCDKCKLPAKERLELFISVCHAVQHAHQKGIIHRDIKPSNILITLHDGVPVPKVIDFGIAKAMQQELTDKTMFTHFQQFVGTPAYISPEQAEMSGLDIDTRADIYSLGVLLFELLVGQTPFDPNDMVKDGIDALRKMISEKEPTRPSNMLATLPDAMRITAGKQRQTEVGALVHQLQGDLDWIVMKCLEKDRKRRYDSASGLAADIQRHLAVEPIVARPPSTAYRIQKAWQRNKFVISSGTLIAVALLVGAGVASWQAAVATRAKRVAEANEDKANQASAKAEESEGEAKLSEIRALASEARTQKLLYGANMNVMQAAFEQDNFLTVQRLLEETASYPDRGFEWYYWQRKMHQEAQIFHGHLAPVEGLAISPDGRLVASGDNHGMIKIWDRATGRVVTSHRMEEEIHHLAFSPGGDKLLACHGPSWLPKNVAVLNLSKADNNPQLPVTKFAGYHGADFSSDDQRLLLWNREEARLVNLTDATQSPTLIELPSPSKRSWLRFTPDGHHVVGVMHESRNRYVVRWWTAQTGELERDKSLSFEEEGNFLDRHYWYATFSPDAKSILMGRYFGTNEVRNLVTGERIGRLVGHTGLMKPMRFSTDGKRILTGSLDRTARLWDAQTLTELRQLGAHPLPVQSVAYSPDGQWLATGDDGGTVRIWEAEATEEPSFSPRCEPLVVNLSPDGRFLALGTGSEAREGDGPLQLLEFTTGEAIRSFFTSTDPGGALTFHTEAIAFSPDGRQVAASFRGQETKEEETCVWDVATGELLAFGPECFWQFRFSPDGLRLISSHGADPSTNGAVTVWQIEAGGKFERILELDHGTASVVDAAFFADGSRIVSSSRFPAWFESDPKDAGIRIWDASDGRELSHFPDKVENQSTLAVSPDGQRIAIPLEGNLVKVFDFGTDREPLVLAGHKERLATVKFSPDGARLLTGAHDHTAKLWDAETGRELLTLKGHRMAVIAAHFFPDGKRILTGAWEKRIRIWEAATPEQAAAWEEAEQAHENRRAAAREEEGR